MKNTTDDLEYLKEIKEAEDRIDNEIKSLKVDQEKKLSDMQLKFEDEMQSRKREFEKLYANTMEKVSAEAAKQAESIIKASREKAESMRLDLPKSEIREIVIRLITEYLEG
ncbi:MAG: hypothetical protein QW597_02120 [Thermoplasmataceae archaeon]